MNSHLTIKSALAKPARRTAANAARIGSVSQKLEPRPMAAVATLKVKIDQQLAVKSLPDGDRWDLRGRWDQIEWKHYEALADGIARTIAVQLKLLLKDVRTDGSILIGHGVAEPRLIVEVPIEHKQKVATDAVWKAIQYVVDRVTGAVALESHVGSSASVGGPEAANDPVAARDGLAPTDLCANSFAPDSAERSAPVEASDDLFDADTKRRLESVARRVLSKVGGATLAIPCRIEVEGLTRPPLEVFGRCADKPVQPSSGPKPEFFECYVDGFIRSRHTVYLIDAAGNGGAREAAMEAGWEDRVAVYASTSYRGRKFRATVEVERKGDKTTRELVDLVYLGDDAPALSELENDSVRLTST